MTWCAIGRKLWCSILDEEWSRYICRDKNGVLDEWVAMVRFGVMTKHKLALSCRFPSQFATGGLHCDVSYCYSELIGARYLLKTSSGDATWVLERSFYSIRSTRRLPCSRDKKKT